MIRAPKKVLLKTALLAYSKSEILLCFFSQDTKYCFHLVLCNLLIPWRL